MSLAAKFAVAIIPAGDWPSWARASPCRPGPFRNQIELADRRPAMSRSIIVRRRDDYPYGKWTCEDGREVLFNRRAISRSRRQRRSAALPSLPVPPSACRSSQRAGSTKTDTANRRSWRAPPPRSESGASPIPSNSRRQARLVRKSIARPLLASIRPRLSRLREHFLALFHNTHLWCVRRSWRVPAGGRPARVGP